MTKILVLFPDTNVFIQCRPLHDLDWAQWQDFDEVRLIVCRTVQAEIDKHKNRGGERLARKARLASTAIRNLIKSDTKCQVIREANPKVTLFLDMTLRPLEDASPPLDYSEPDDSLVGTTLSFSRGNPEFDVRVLTDDTGPMASAAAVGVGSVEVPHGWLLPPETTAAEKEIRALKAEVALLKEQEPRLEIQCLDEEGKSIKEVSFQRRSYKALSEEEVSGLLMRLQERFPIAADFGSKEVTERPAGFNAFGNAMEMFVPATDKEIDTYRQDYAKWRTNCQEMLRSYHTHLEAAEYKPLVIQFKAKNVGTRPANSTLTTISVHGKFKLMLPLEKKTEEDEERKGKAKPKDNLSLPMPPNPPSGKWQRQISPLEKSVADMLRPFRGLAPFGGIAGTSDESFDHTLLFQGPHIPRMRDPNRFYYKPRRPTGLVASYALECAQWRHGIDAELFDCLLFPSTASDGERVSGLLEFRCHAQNMSEPQALKIPLRVEGISAAAYSSAKAAVEHLGRLQLGKLIGKS